MKLTLQKFHIAWLMLELKFAAITKNAEVQHTILERMVLLHIQMRVAKEQNINKLLFSNL